MAREIVYITECSGFAGAEKYLLHLCEEAISTKAKVAVALHFAEANARLRSVLEDLGVQTLDVRYHKANYLLNFANALRFFRERRHCFFHFSLPHVTSCPLLLMVARLLRCDYVITEHLAPPTPSSGGPFVLLNHLLFNRSKRLAYEHARGVAAVSQQLKNILVDSYGMPASKIAVIYNGVSTTAPTKTAEQSRKDLGIGLDDTVVTNVARLDPQKGQCHLIPAVKRIATKYPRLKVLLVGDGPDKEKTSRLVKEHGLEDVIAIMGFRNDVPDILSCSDIFVLPSLNEGFPFSIVEAMAAGLPVIATDVGGNAEAVIDGETGRVIPPSDVTALSDAMVELIADAEKRMHMGLRGKLRADSEFSLSNMLHKTFRLYPPQ
jgi:Glycosyltransferase